jgi:hypothetical protein
MILRPDGVVKKGKEELRTRLRWRQGSLIAQAQGA